MNFNWEQYIQNYPDLSGFTREKAIRHYNRFGKFEGRSDKIIYQESKIISQESKNLFDIVIPLGPNDISFIEHIVLHCKNNIIDYRNIYIITKDNNIPTDCIFIDENSFPFKLEDFNSLNNRKNWYLQQLLKLYAWTIPGILDNYLVIDADTYFLKPTTFMENDLFLFNTSGEFHTPYFTHMKKLHPTLIRKLDCSGICHHMIFNKSYINELFELVSQYHNCEFWKAFLKCVEPSESSGAAEYEIYFNFMLIYHPESIKIRNLNWANLRSYSIGNYDYISIHWYSRQV
uniref:Nucleotide-diphospho-sugar transferase domain-containing protein n=1 Tax=viral metagenome TaxID=1070528 RepID=A0A6C0AYH6_9ZZZZ